MGKLNEWIEFRKEVLLECEKKPEIRPQILHKCKDDVEFFINCFCFTYDPRKPMPHLPFILYDFQKGAVSWILGKITDKENGLVEKSRDMGATWVFIAVFVHQWLFSDGFFALMGSRKESLVDKSLDLSTLFERFRYILYRLPYWMLPEGYTKNKHDNYLRIINPIQQNSITGESANKDFGRASRATVVLLDEFASWEQDDASYQAVSQVSPTIFLLSTPNGRLNAFARIRFKSNIDILRLHWTEHPEKTQEWYDKIVASGTMTKEQIASEIDINYEASAGRPVYREYSGLVHDVVEYIPNGEQVIHRGWDFGYHHPSCVFTQQNEQEHLTVFYEVLGIDMRIQDFLLIVKYCSRQFLEPDHIERVKYVCCHAHVEGITDISQLMRFKSTYDDYCDTAGSQTSDKSPLTSIQILDANGISCSHRPSRIDEGVHALRRMMMSGLFSVDKRCILIRDGLAGGYHYKDDESKDEIEKDGYYDHLLDSLRYIIHILYDYLTIKEVKVVDKYQEMVKKGYPQMWVDALKEDDTNYQPDREAELRVLRKKTGGTGYG